MDKKSEARLALEARAKELDVSFAPNIGDEKLAAKVAKAEAETAKNTSPGERADVPTGGASGEGSGGGGGQPAAATSNDGGTVSGNDGGAAIGAQDHDQLAICTARVRFQGKVREPGTVIALGADDFAALTKAGAVELAPDDPSEGV